MTKVSTQQGDTVDLVCRRVYGDESGFVEAVLSANPGLAALGPILPIGTTIELPSKPLVLEVSPVSTLWD